MDGCNICSHLRIYYEVSEVSVFKKYKRCGIYIRIYCVCYYLYPPFRLRTII